MMQASAFTAGWRVTRNQIQTKTGTAMAKGTIAVSLDLRENNENKDGTLWVLITAFGKLADILERHKQADLINVSGKCTAIEVHHECRRDKGKYQRHY